MEYACTIIPRKCTRNKKCQQTEASELRCRKKKRRVHTKVKIKLLR